MTALMNQPSCLASLTRTTVRCFAGALALTALAACTAPVDADSPDVEAVGAQSDAIRRGTVVTPYDYIGKSVVRIEVPLNATEWNACTGVIIDSNHVLTAAHCGAGLWTRIQHYTGSALNGDTNFVWQVTPTPSSVTTLADVVMLTTYYPINLNKYVPVELPNAWGGFTPGAKYYAVGQGLHDGVGPVGELRWTEVGIGNFEFDRSIMLNRAATDKGDSGGPLLEFFPDRGRFRVVGILHGTFPNWLGTTASQYSNMVELRKFGWPY
jgi:hypothetical protein